MKDAAPDRTLHTMKRRGLELAGAGTKVSFLGHPAAYPGRRCAVKVIETHFSWVFLAGTHAYKMKKPVRQEAMDYRTIAGRRRGCRAEVRLNRRLAPAVYLGAVPLGRRADGQLVLGPGGRVVDWLVAMRRLPAARMLDVAMVRRTATAAEVRAVIRLLADFYARARPRPMAPRTYLGHLRHRILRLEREWVRSGFQFPRSTVQALVDAQLGFIARHARRLGERGSRLVEGHGDLRPEHVYLGSSAQGPAVIDCLEFDASLRRLDPIEEVAFLAMECTAAGATQVARALLNGIRSQMHDGVSDAIVHFYMSQRAATRAALSARHLLDPELAPQFPHWRARAEAYLDRALLYARAALRESTPGSRSLQPGHRPALD
jgi:aminoglycoside phosphotransferase family enzyme